jgi:Protein of unknown function (DUF3106)
LFKPGFVVSLATLFISGILAGTNLHAQSSANPTVTPAKLPETKTSVAPVRNLAALVQPLWVDLSPAQQQALAPFSARWNTFPREEKLSWVKLANRFGSMNPEQTAKLQTRMRGWADLSPEQRVRARANYNLASKVPQDQRVAEFEQYRGMTPEQRKILRSAGKTSNTAALYSGTRSGLATEAAQPLIAEGVSASKPAAAPIKKSSTK